MKKSTIITTISISVFCLLIFVLATIYDLQISSVLADLDAGQYYSDNFFAILFEIIGESFLYIMLACAVSILLWWAIYFLNKNFKIISGIIFPFLILGVYIFMMTRIFGYVADYQILETGGYMWLAYIFISMLLTTSTIFAFKAFKPETIKSLTWFALIVILVAAISNAFTQLVKGEVFGRMRYRAMNSINDFSNFTPWFIMNGGSLAEQFNLTAEAFRSFPSGHTTAAASTFCLIALPHLFSRLNTKWGKVICYGLPILITSLVGLSRIIAGAHFLTDVLFAMFMTAGLAILFTWLLVIRRKNKF